MVCVSAGQLDDDLVYLELVLTNRTALVRSLVFLVLEALDLLLGESFRDFPYFVAEVQELLFEVKSTS